MTLQRLDVLNLRNIGSAALEPSPRLNLLVGANGSGKTSLMEAIFLLGRGRSFRTAQAGQIIQFQRDELTVTGKVADQPGAVPEHIGVRLSRKGRELVLRGQRLQSSAELIRALPVLLIQPTASALLENSPKVRRQFLDWGCFHREPDYLDHWRAGIRALNQRNALLKAGDLRNLDPWNHELARYGKMIGAARLRYVAELESHFIDVARHFLDSHTFTIECDSGWDLQRDLVEILHHDTARDRQQGYTRAGPQRADFMIRADGRNARHYLSRGQSKLLVFALLLAQAQCLEVMHGNRGCVLIDDLASELDPDNRARLLAYLQQRQTQFFISATDRQLLHDVSPDASTCFDVRDGTVSSS